MSLSKFCLTDEELEEEAIESLLFERIDNFVEEPITKKKRSLSTKVDYWDTTWVVGCVILGRGNYYDIDSPPLLTTAPY